MRKPPHIVDVSRETLLAARKRFRARESRYEEYLEKLLWWNQRVNLVSRGVSRETLREHVVHCLLPLELGLFDGVDEWIDAGSGGGLPGIPLSIESTGNDGKRWLLNDKSLKKVAALRQMVSELELANIRVEGGSVASLIMPAGAGIVTKHAFAVGTLAGMVSDKPWRRLICFKGSGEALAELEEARISGSAALYRFQFGATEKFYEGKALLKIEKKEINTLSS